MKECRFCQTDITCTHCGGSGRSEPASAIDNPGADENRCYTCHGDGEDFWHACIHLYDELGDPSVIPSLAERVADPIAHLTGMRRIDAYGCGPDYFEDAFKVPPPPSTEFVTGFHREYRWSPSTEGGVPISSGPMGYFLTLRFAELLLKSTSAATITMKLDSTWDPQFATLCAQIGACYRQDFTFVLHRLFVGRHG